MPGHIYVEVSAFEQAQQLARAISSLNSNVIRPVPSEELRRIVSVSSPTIEHHTWARVRGTRKGWKHYQGDVGLIDTTGWRNSLMLVPRIPVVPGLPAEKCPAQILAQRATLVSNFGMGAVRDGG
jgi:hypothetical protein